MHAYRALTEPPGPSQPALGDRRAVPVEQVFDGVRPASSLPAVGLDVLVAFAVGALALLASRAWGLSMAGAAVVAAVVVLAAAGWCLLDLVRTGRSPGHRVLGTRTIDSVTGLPASLRRLASARTANIRAGRDPVRVMPSGDVSAPLQVDQWQFTAARALSAPIVLVLDSGMSFNIVEPTIIGRNPAQLDQAAKLLQIPDLSRTMSKSHALLEPQGRMMWITDLGSMNGTAVAVDGGPLEPLEPHVRTVVRSGSTVEFGDRLATLGTSAPPSSVSTADGQADESSSLEVAH